MRKNIHHHGGKAPTASHAPPTSSSSSGSVMQTAGHYSRHGAIAAQHSPVLPKSNKDTVAKCKLNACYLYEYCSLIDV